MSRIRNETRGFLGATLMVAFVVVAASGCEEPCDSDFDCAVGESCAEGSCVPVADDDGGTPEPTTPPDTTLTVVPSVTRESSVASEIGCDQTGCTFECRVGNAPFDSCLNDHTFTLGGEGIYVLQARAINSANFVDDTPAEQTVRVDLTAPELTIDEQPPEQTAERDALISFSCDENCTATCSLDGAPSVACESPFAANGLGDGAHSVAIVPTDVVGNAGGAVTAEWTVDGTAPVVTIIDGPPAFSNDDNATITFSCDEDCATTCALNAATPTACTSPFLVSPGEGTHTLDIVATDTLGNTAEAVVVEWVVDATAPETTIVTTPIEGGQDYRVQVGFECDDASCTFECRLEDADFAACTSPVELVALEPGARAFSVRATDAAGNVDETPALTTWNQARTWTDIAASHHYCAIATNGSLWCWGDNSRGQVGLGAAGDDVLAPTNVGGDDWLDVANGEFHTCAVKTDGSLWCWGANDFGQLGHGVDAPDSAFPRRVGNANDWVGVWRDGASALHSCGLSLTDVFCWGRNVDGEVGIGSVDDRVWAPSLVALSEAEDRVSLAFGRTTSTPNFFYWGEGIGEEPEANLTNVPVRIQTTVQETVDLLANMQGACFLATNAGPYVANVRGDVRESIAVGGLCGYGTTSNIASRFNEVDGTCLDSGVVDLGCGVDFYCAIFEAGNLWCFGENVAGLGGTSLVNFIEEQGIEPAGGWKRFAGGVTRSLILKESGELRSVGLDTAELVSIRVN